MKYHQYFT